MVKGHRYKTDLDRPKSTDDGEDVHIIDLLCDVLLFQIC